jgi:glycosyltransferase involved in cell wall biosynthesis
MKKKYHLIWVDINIACLPSHVTTWLETTRELRELDWRVTLVLGGPSGQQNIQGVDVLCIPKSQSYFIGYFMFHLRLLRFLVKDWADVDAILFHPMSAIWLLPLRFIRKLRGEEKPLLVMDTRDRDPAGGTIKNRLRVLYGNLASKLANRWADGQTAITIRMSDLVRIPKNQLWGIWPSGVSLEPFTSVRARRKWPQIGEPVHLIYIGSLLHVRNLLPMCQAVEQVNAENVRFKFSLYGEGTAKADLETFAQKTDGRIQIFSPVLHDQIPTVLTQAHVGVNSLFAVEQELFQASSPVKLFEYMASGLPILAPRMPCYSDVIGHGKYVFWIEHAGLSDFLTALQHIWDQRFLLNEMGSQSATAALDWTWHASAVKLKSALEYGLERYKCNL